MKIRFYSKPDCPLCEKALKLVLELQQEHDFQLEQINILEDQTLFDRFCFDIPVVEINESIKLKGIVDKHELLSAVQEAEI